MVQKKKSNFRGKVATDAQRQQKATSSYGHLLLPKGINVFNPEPGGRVKLDFMPYMVSDPKHPDRNETVGTALPESLWYKRPYKLHRNIGAENNSYVCLTSIGKKCPVCEARARRIKDGAEKEETDPLKPSQRNLYVVIPIEAKKFEEVPHIFDISQYNFQNLLNDELEEDDSNEVFPDLEEGLTLKVRFDSKTIGGSQPFAQASRIDFEERAEAYDEAILDDIPNLDEVLKILTYKELEAKFLEVEDEDEGGSLREVEEKPKHKKKPVEEEEEEEEEEETPRKKKTVKKVEEEEEEEETPRKKKPLHKKPVEEEEEEEEEEDSKKPVRGTPSTTKRSLPVETGKKNKCPHGYKFGEDHEQYDECEDCKLWDACLEQKEK